LKPLVGIIMGSDSDLPVMKEARDFLDELDVPHSVEIVSAHRTTRKMVKYASDARKNGVKVIIAGAGGAAHLPGMVASLTSLPVIGVPIRTKSLDGLDSLLSIAQMPPGVPVATVAINGAKNAAILACQILAVAHPIIGSKIERYKKNLEEGVMKKDRLLGKVGVEAYLKGMSAGKQ
jgi:5-(carboxyamino)imidazole ribonucleotide mutase